MDEQELNIFLQVVSEVAFFVCDPVKSKRIEYIERNLLEKSVKQPFCCTVSILQVYFTYLCYINLLGPGTSFHRKSKINIKRKPNYETGFIIDQWSFHIDSMPFILQTMTSRYNYISNDVFYSPNSFYKVYLTALNNSKLKWII